VEEDAYEGQGKQFPNMLPPQTLLSMPLPDRLVFFFVICCRRKLCSLCPFLIAWYFFFVSWCCFFCLLNILLPQTLLSLPLTDSLMSYLVVLAVVVDAMYTYVILLLI
jgi:hypothetical protein